MTQHPLHLSSAPSSSNPREAWERVRAHLRFTYGEATFNSWFKSLSFVAVEGNEIILTAPTRFLCEWIQAHYLDDICTSWRNTFAGASRVSLRVVRAEASTAASAPMNEQHEQAIAARVLYSAATPQPVISLPAVADIPGFSDAVYDPRFTFADFITGPSNVLAFSAAKAIAHSDKALPGSNPLYIHGSVGLGKTHLLHATAQHLRQQQPQRKVGYLSAERFMFQFIRALRNRDIVEFKQRLRSLDVLMMDDIQFICGKDSTQEEFYHTFNALMDSGRQLIIAADRPPGDMDGMDERIRSRLGGGLVADIGQTTRELRLGVLTSKAKLVQVPIPHDVLELLAEKITSNLRELEGAFNRVVAHASLMQHDITVQSAQDILRDVLRANTRSLSIEDIQKAVSEHCQVKVTDMCSSRRSQSYARPRQVAMYLAKKLTPCSLPEIGRKFGGRDHTTVMHAVRRIEALAAADPGIAKDLSLLTRILQS